MLVFLSSKYTRAEQSMRGIAVWLPKLSALVHGGLSDISKFFGRESLRDGMNSIYNCGVKGKL